MARRSTFKEYNTFIILYRDGDTYKTCECVGAKSAVDMYRFYREKCGIDVRLLKVVLNYGEEV